jgi:hypothetical protein
MTASFVEPRAHFVVGRGHSKEEEGSQEELRAIKFVESISRPRAVALARNHLMVTNKPGCAEFYLAPAAVCRLECAAEENRLSHWLRTGCAKIECSDLGKGRTEMVLKLFCQDLKFVRMECAGVCDWAGIR